MDIGIILCFQTFTEYALKKNYSGIRCALLVEFIDLNHVSQLSGVVFIVVYNSSPFLVTGASVLESEALYDSL